MYVQVPVSAFYFVLGLVCGVVGLVCILNILAKKQQQQEMNKYKRLFDEMNRRDDDDK